MGGATTSEVTTKDTGTTGSVVFGIEHPASVHLFRNAIEELRERGWDVHVFVLEKDIAVDLLERYDVPHTVLARYDGSKGGLVTSQLAYEYRLLKAARRIDPDVMVAQEGVAVSHVAPLAGSKSLVFLDTEHAKLQLRLLLPFADRICTATSFIGDISRRQVRYPYYHELAYLHPNRFTPDPAVFEDLHIDADDRFVVLRTVAWDAAHDIGEQGIDDPVALVEGLESMGAEVLITAEGELPARLEPYRTDVSPDAMHDLLYYAELFVGESPTMAAESAVLGTPAIYVGSLDLGYTNELDERYDLVYNLGSEDGAARSLELARGIFDEPDSTWETRRARLLEDKVDATSVILAEIEQMVDS
ncbi:DUF354 domain-containing protein [Haloterrigena alkaliphila]|uniref:DUF354 domain-containing protein n=1 Tax=Haloterrigena alkaliphila TaxID=2816475 RepID=A0A8A2VH66_9EURY|nr:DUF354 domain-containing protein [Haloterrigena alkaliphila]QSX00041.1 DUF354 domain-containing protein [Haloterrigena alkaliphila]